MDRGEADNMNADRREMTDTCLIVSGGPTDRKFAAEFVKNRKYPYVIAVDAGLAVCEELGLVPDLAVGDFDTFGLERMEELRKKEGWATDVHKPEKDETDTDLAVRSALRAGFSPHSKPSYGVRAQLLCLFQPLFRTDVQGQRLHR